MKNYIHSLMTDKKNDPLAYVCKLLLWALSLGYAFIVFITRLLYVWKVLPAYRSPKPVISVGNITLGGSGKTPVVICLAKELTNRGLSPVILTRGYMAGAKARSDEVLMMEEALPKVPLMVGQNRVVNIQSVVDTLPVDVFICDDAFQHWPLKRDLDIVLIDATNPFGNGHYLPRGILREPLSALNRAHIFVLTKTDKASNLALLYQRLTGINPQALVVEARHSLKHFVNIEDGKIHPLEHLKAKAVLAVSGIGDPAYFQDALSRQGITIKESITFMDHHSYTQEDVAQMVQKMQDNEIKFCVTTHKDAVKIKPFQHIFKGAEFLYLSIELEITKGKDEFFQRVMAITRH